MVRFGFEKAVPRLVRAPYGANLQMAADLGEAREGCAETGEVIVADNGRIAADLVRLEKAVPRLVRSLLLLPYDQLCQNIPNPKLPPPTPPERSNGLQWTPVDDLTGGF